MMQELSYKHQILLKGGSYDEHQDTVQNWLTFLTDPANLQLGLPNLALAIGEWNIFYIRASFDKTKASLLGLTLELNSFDESEVSIFRDPNPADTIPNDSTTGVSNPHHLHKWVFDLFKHSALEVLEIPFLIPELPDLFDKLPNLKYVSIKKSTLVRLPASFYKLSTLNELDMVGSLIPELPAELKALSTLKRLAFNQQFKPEVLGSLTSLSILQCSCPGLNVRLPRYMHFFG